MLNSIASLFFTFLLLAGTASATLRTLTVHGQFKQQRNPGYFGLALPIPFDFFVQYDDTAVNTGTPTIAVYETEGAYGGLSFGTGIGFHFVPFVNTEVRVWNDQFKAVSFGNEDAVSAYGLSIPPYFIYAIFANYFFDVPGWDTSLHWVADLAGDPRFEWTAYVFLDGTAAPNTETLLQTGSDPQHYSVQ